MNRERWQQLLAAALALAVWQGAAMLVHAPILLPSPLRVADRLGALLVTLDFWSTVGFSLLRIAGGFLLALAAATVLAFGAGRFSLLEILLRPYVLAIKSVPVASFIILALIWLRTSQLSLFISFLMVFPVLYTNVLTGIRGADGQLLEMARVFRVPWKRRVRMIYLPAVEPFLLAGCATSLGMSWKAGVAAEVIGVVSGSLGERLYDAKIYLMTADLLAWTVVIVALSAGFEKLVLWLLRHIFRRIGGAPACLMAPSGRGKTTLLRCIAGLERPDSGQITDLPERIGYVFQEDRLCDGFSAVDNIRLVTGRAMDEGEICRHLKELGLADSLGQPVRELSGGMRRRVSIGRAVCFGAGLLLLDEPFNGLDDATRQQTADYILRHRSGAAILCVTHDREDAAALGGAEIMAF